MSHVNGLNGVTANSNPFGVSASANNPDADINSVYAYNDGNERQSLAERQKVLSKREQLIDEYNRLDERPLDDNFARAEKAYVLKQIQDLEIENLNIKTLNKDQKEAYNIVKQNFSGEISDEEYADYFNNTSDSVKEYMDAVTDYVNNLLGDVKNPETLRNLEANIPDNLILYLLKDSTGEYDAYPDSVKTSIEKMSAGAYYMLKDGAQHDDSFYRKIHQNTKSQDARQRSIDLTGFDPETGRSQ